MTDFAEETARLTRSRMIYASAVFLIVMAVAGVIEHYAHSGRDLVFAVILLAQALVIGASILAMRRWKSATVPIATVAISVLCCLIAVYHIAVYGEAEILAMALAYLVIGTTVALPWGVRGQLPVAATALFAYGLAVAAGVHAPISAGMALIGLAAIGSVSVMGAYFLDHYRRSIFTQAQALQTANAALMESSRLRNDFIAGVSHELRTPLNIIIGYTDLLLDNNFGELPPPMREPLRRVDHSAQQLLHLINDLIDLSRVEAGRLRVDMKSVPLSTLFDEMNNLAESLLRDRPIRFRSSLDDGIRVQADTERLRQVLLNLIGNAAKYTAVGEIVLCAAEADDEVDISVQDTGVGIPEAELQDIFRPFFRGSLRGDVTGAGLGLSLSSRLAALMGGSIAVASRPGEGSTFTLHLKRARS